MLIVDAQVHIWGQGLPTNRAHRQIPRYSKDDLLKEMDKGGIDAAVIHPPGWDPNSNQVRLWLFILAYNLGNFLRRLGLPREVKEWSLRSLQVKLIKIGGRMVRHARRIVFQLAEVAVSWELFAAILDRLRCLRVVPG